jgi:hypothetical protein
MAKHALQFQKAVELLISYQWKKIAFYIQKKLDNI